MNTAANDKWIQQQTPSGYSTAANDKCVQQQRCYRTPNPMTLNKTSV